MSIKFSQSELVGNQEDLIELEEDLILKLNEFASEYPGFSYKITRDFDNNKIKVQTLNLMEYAN